MPPPRLSRPRESTSRRSIGGETALDDRTKLQLIEPVGRQVRQMRQMAASPLAGVHADQGSNFLLGWQTRDLGVSAC
jgi:hypothetical protein